MRRFTLALIAINIVLLVLVLSPLRQLFAQPTTETVASALRARSLEIVDERGRTRAQIPIAPSKNINGIAYPEIVLFRLIDPDCQPTVKMGASIEGSGNLPARATTFST